MSTVRILVDNSVRNISKAAIEEHVDPPPERPMGNKVLMLRGVHGKDPLPPSHAFLHRQIDCLPTIARLAKEGVIDFYSYPGVWIESLGIPRSFPEWPLTDIFNGVTFRTLRSAVEYFAPPYTYTAGRPKKEFQIELCKVLLDRQDKGGNAARLHVLRSICDGLSENHFDDVLHLWSAEIEGMQYFLTVDGKFVNALKQNKTCRLQCRLVTPTDLLEGMGITGRDPWPFEPGRLYTPNGHPS